MKFVTFNARTSTDRLGAVDTDGRIIDLAEVSHLQRKRETECFSSMQTLIESGRDGLKAASHICSTANDMAAANQPPVNRSCIATRFFFTVSFLF